MIKEGVSMIKVKCVMGKGTHSKQRLIALVACLLRASVPLQYNDAFL